MIDDPYVAVYDLRADLSALNREHDALEGDVRRLETNLVRVTKLLDDVSRELAKRITELETELTFHEEKPHAY